MPGVDAAPEDLEGFATHLTRTQKEIEEIASRTKSAFDRLRWNDSERRKFEQSLDGAIRALRSAAHAVEPLPKILRKKASHLREFQR